MSISTLARGIERTCRSAFNRYVTAQQRWVFLRDLEEKPAVIRWFGARFVRFYLSVRGI